MKKVNEPWAKEFTEKFMKLHAQITDIMEECKAAKAAEDDERFKALMRTADSYSNRIVGMSDALYIFGYDYEWDKEEQRFVVVEAED